MPYTAAVKAEILNGMTIDKVSLHSGFPGTTGANELSGGAPAYVRVTIAVNAASGDSRLLSAAVNINVPASTVSWIGFWDNTTFLFPVPNGGGVPKNFVAVHSEDRIYAPAHGYTDTQKIVFFGTPPTGTTEGTTYFVRDALPDSFKVAATSGGAAIDMTATSSAGCWVISIVETVYPTDDVHSLSAATFSIPN